MSGLRQVEHSVAGDAIGGRARGRFLKHADDVITAAFCKCGQFRDLPFTGLIRSRNPGVDGRALSQLNPLRFWPCKPLILLVRILS